VYGDYLLAHVQEAVDVAPLDFVDLPEKDWALDGTRTGTGTSRIVSPLGFDKAGRPSEGIENHLRAIVAKQERIVAEEVRVESGHTDDAETVVVAFGPPGKFVKYVVDQLRAEGEKIGYVRPITLWPFPYEAVADAAEGARRVGVFEICAGQMIDDVRLGVLGRAPVEFIGGISTDGSGFGVGPLLDVELIRARVLALHRDEPMPPLPHNDRQF
jgi:2-oxoglutarate ferredoxin oxidoreductase subunit alpha